jgi:hypothetical protein
VEKRPMPKRSDECAISSSVPIVIMHTAEHSYSKMMISVRQWTEARLCALRN